MKKAAPCISQQGTAFLLSSPSQDLFIPLNLIDKGNPKFRVVFRGRFRISPFKNIFTSGCYSTVVHGTLLLSNYPMQNEGWNRRESANLGVCPTFSKTIIPEFILSRIHFGAWARVRADI